MIIKDLFLSRSYKKTFSDTDIYTTFSVSVVVIWKSSQSQILTRNRRIQLHRPAAEDRPTGGTSGLCCFSADAGRAVSKRSLSFQPFHALSIAIVWSVDAADARRGAAGPWFKGALQQTRLHNPSSPGQFRLVPDGKRFIHKQVFVPQKPQRKFTCEIPLKNEGKACFQGFQANGKNPEMCNTLIGREGAASHLASPAERVQIVGGLVRNPRLITAHQ